MEKITRPNFGDPYKEEREALLKGFKHAEDPYLREVYLWSTENQHTPAVVKKIRHIAAVISSKKINGIAPFGNAPDTLVGDPNHQAEREALGVSYAPSNQNPTDVASVGGDTHGRMAQVLQFTGASV